MAKIIKRAGMWYSDFRQDNKRIRRALSPFKEVAQTKLEDLLQVRQSYKAGCSPKDVSWFYFEEKYLAYSKADKDPQTYDNDERVFRMLRTYGPPIVRFSQMSPDFLDRFKAKCREKKVSEKTISGYLRLLKTAVHKAEEWKMGPLQNWRTVKTLPDGKRVLYFDMAQFRQVLEACQGHWKTAAMLMGFAGLRSGEVRHLEWCDIDFKNRLIEIRVKKGWSPKSSRGDDLKERKVDMPAELETYLAAMPERSGYVLGELIKKGTYRLHFGRNLSKKVGFKVYAHMFRHTYASFLISTGSTLAEVGALMGHSDARSTQIYAHMMPHARRTAVDRMQSYLGPVSSAVEQPLYMRKATGSIPVPGSSLGSALVPVKQDS